MNPTKPEQDAPEPQAERASPSSGNGFTRTATGYFDHEKLEVYRVALEFLEIANTLSSRKMSRDLRDQFERASNSILANIAEGAGKTARADKERFYEIARGSTTEAAGLLDIMRVRGFVTPERYQQARDSSSGSLRC